MTAIGPVNRLSHKLTNLTGMPSGPVEVSDLSVLSVPKTSPCDNSRSLKEPTLSSGRLSTNSARHCGVSLLLGRVLSAVKRSNSINFSGSCHKGCWFGFRIRCITRYTSFGLLEDNACRMKVSRARQIAVLSWFLTSRNFTHDSWEPVWWASFLDWSRCCMLQWTNLTVFHPRSRWSGYTNPPKRAFLQRHLENKLLN